MKYNSWFFKYKEINEIPKEILGFVYKITNNKTGKFYVGKKQVWYTRKKKLGKKALIEKAKNYNKRGKMPNWEWKTTESDWKNYYGSSKLLKEDIKKYGKENFKREILKFCYTKKQLTYYEIYYQIKEEVLHKETYNDNILGKFFRKDLDTPK